MGGGQTNDAVQADVANFPTPYSPMTCQKNQTLHWERGGVPSLPSGLRSSSRPRSFETRPVALRSTPSRHPSIRSPLDVRAIEQDSAHAFHSRCDSASNTRPEPPLRVR